MESVQSAGIRYVRLAWRIGFAGTAIQNRENRLHVHVAQRFSYPQEIQLKGHLTTNDTSKSLTSPSDRLSPSSCLHRAFLLGFALSLLSRRCCRCMPSSSHFISRTSELVACPTPSTTSLRAIFHPLHWTVSASLDLQTVAARVSQSMLCLAPSMSSSPRMSYATQVDYHNQ
jgi:hypothetical protein